MTDAPRVAINVRLKQEALDRIDTRADRDARTRADVIRLMLAYAEQHMPKGWTP